MTISVNKRSLVSTIILLILAALYSVVFFVVPFTKQNNTAFYLAYGATILMFLVAIIIFIIAFGGCKDLKTRVFGIPLARISLAILILQTLIDAAVIACGVFYFIPNWAVIVVEIALIAFTLIGIIIRSVYRETINNNDEKQESKEAFIKELRIEIDMLVRENKNEALQAPLHKLQDLIKYTTPVSSNEVVSIENDIIESMNDLHNSENVDQTIETIDKIITLLNERKARLQK